MFEKEAEKYAKDCEKEFHTSYGACLHSFKDGAEFGYNLAYKEIDTEKMLKVLKDRDVVKSWYNNGAYHAEVEND